MFSTDLTLRIAGHKKKIMSQSIGQSSTPVGRMFRRLLLLSVADAFPEPQLPCVLASLWVVFLTRPLMEDRRRFAVTDKECSDAPIIVKHRFVRVDTIGEGQVRYSLQTLTASLLGGRALETRLQSVRTEPQVGHKLRRRLPDSFVSCVLRWCCLPGTSPA
jgi:hypothetical protein